MVAVTGAFHHSRVGLLAGASLALLIAIGGESEARAPRPPDDSAMDPEALAEASCLDVTHFANVVEREPDAAVLYLVKAVVRDDGGGEGREPVNIDLLVLAGRRFDTPLNRVRLYGPIDAGVDLDGSRKLEWNDDLFLRYNRFGLVTLDHVRGRKIRLIAAAGAHPPGARGGVEKAFGRNVVFDGVIDLEALPWGEVVRVEGRCDRPGRCMTLWLARENAATGGTGRYWKCP